MAIGRPLKFDHDVRLKMSSALHRKLKAAAAKLRRPMPDFLRLVLEDAVAERELPDGWTRLNPAQKK